MPLRACVLSAAIAASLSAPAAFAVDPERQPTVVVTANRSERPIDQSLASVSVLDRASIEASQAPDLVTLLARQPGLDVSRTGGPGSASTLFVRGGNANHVLVLVDGVRVASSGQGVFDLAHVPLEQVERIEIVRGPRAALWGSDALAGVLQIFTRPPQTRSARLATGTWGLREGSVGLGHRSGRGALGVTAGYTELDGFSASNEDSFSFDPDDDGYRKRHLGLRGDTALGRQTLAFSLLGTDADVDFDQGRTFARNQSGALTLEGPMGSRWSQALVLGHAREDLDTPAFGSAFESRRHSLDASATHPLGADGQITAGVNWQREHGRSLSGFDGEVYRRGRSNTAAFAGYAGSIDRHELELALRHDENSQFGSATTGSAGWGFRPGAGTRVRLGWGQGFRAPNLNELYSPGFGGLFAGNPALQPERSHTLEAGFELLAGPRQRIGISAWRSRVDNLVSFSGPDFQAINVARASIDGVELEHHWRAGGWSIDSHVTWQDPRDADSGERLLRRPGRKAHVSPMYRFGNGAKIGASVTYASAREDFDGTLPAYTVTDVHASLPLRGDWRVDLRLGNVGDRDYQLASGYNTPGRHWGLALVWAPARGGS